MNIIENQIQVASPSPLPANLAAQDVLAYLLTRKGQIVTVHARREMKTRKAVVSTVEKESVFQAQVGVDYDNKARVIEKRESGELPTENAGLPWGQWVQFPYVIEHKGNFYFRFSVVRNNFIPSVKYFIDGVETTKEQITPLCLASEFAEKTGECFNFKLKDIIGAK